MASDGLKGRVFAVSLADLNKDEDRAYRTMKFVVEDVQGKNCLTNFHGMTFTSDKVKGLIKKWQSLIEGLFFLFFFFFYFSYLFDTCSDHLSQRRSQDHRWIHSPPLCRWIHQEKTKPSQTHHLCPKRSN